MSIERKRDWVYPENLDSTEKIEEYLRKHYVDHVEEASSRIEDLRVTNERIDANTISCDKLLVTPRADNLIIDADFELGDVTEEWEISGQCFSTESTVVNNGGYSARLTADGTDLEASNKAQGGYIPVVPGAEYYFEGYHKNSDSGLGNSGFIVTFYDANKANGSSTNYLSDPGTSWTKQSGNLTVPAGKYFMRLVITVRSGMSSGYGYFDDIILREIIDGGVFISDGSILVAGLNSEVTDQMFTSLQARENIEAWRHASDVTLIDGGKLYAKTITADKFQTDILGMGNQVDNGNFEDWTNGTSSDPNGWTSWSSDSSHSIAREGTTVKLSDYSAKLKRSGANCMLYQDIHSEKGIDYWQGRDITLGCWAWADTANRVRLKINDGTDSTHSDYHAGDSSWERLTVTHTIHESATMVRLELWIWTGDVSAYFDGVMAVEGDYAYPFEEKRDWGHPDDYTLIDGGYIKTNTVDADRLNVSELSAITADVGTLTSGKIYTDALYIGTDDTAYESAKYVQAGVHRALEALSHDLMLEGSLWVGTTGVKFGAVSGYPLKAYDMGGGQYYLGFDTSESGGGEGTGDEPGTGDPEI